MKKGVIHRKLRCSGRVKTLSEQDQWLWVELQRWNQDSRCGLHLFWTLECVHVLPEGFRA